MVTFITGGTSSIGRVLIKALAKDGQQLRVLVRQNSNRTGLELPGVEFVIGDVTDPEIVRQGMAGCERVCHLAAVVGSVLGRQEPSGLHSKDESQQFTAPDKQFIESPCYDK